MTPADLIAFEEDIAEEFNAGRIRAPVHLSSGNESQLIDIFENVRPYDWVCCSWRSHLHCLLKGVPAEQVKAEIMAGRSIALCFHEYRVVSSAIVGGIVPIAVGLAMAVKMAAGTERVWCFLGEMTAETGIAWECLKYTSAHGLHLTFVVEDNGLSVCTDTRAAWNTEKLLSEQYLHPNVLRYAYKSKWPHAGAGKRIQF